MVVVLDEMDKWTDRPMDQPTQSVEPKEDIQEAFERQHSKESSNPLWRPTIELGHKAAKQHEEAPVEETPTNATLEKCQSHQPTGKVVHVLAYNMSGPVSGEMAARGSHVGVLRPLTLTQQGKKWKQQGMQGPIPAVEKYVQFEPRDKRLPFMHIARADGVPLDFLHHPTSPLETSILYEAEMGAWPHTSKYPKAVLVGKVGQVGSIHSETMALLASNNVDASPFTDEVLDDLRAFSEGQGKRLFGYWKWDMLSIRTSSKPDITSTFIIPNINMYTLSTSSSISTNPPSIPQTHPLDTWSIPLEEVAKRRDYRQTCIFTIDPLTAKDLDDALHITPLPDGTFEIGVHIADVTYFVRPGTEVDKEAAKRATSCYLVQVRMSKHVFFLVSSLESGLYGCYSPTTLHTIPSPLNMSSPTPQHLLTHLY